MSDIADRLDELAKGAPPLPNTCSEGAAEIRQLRERIAELERQLTRARNRRSSGLLGM
jgi:hypothetical protein